MTFCPDIEPRTSSRHLSAAPQSADRRKRDIIRRCLAKHNMNTGYVREIWHETRCRIYTSLWPGIDVFASVCRPLYSTLSLQPLTAFPYHSFFYFTTCYLREIPLNVLCYTFILDGLTSIFTQCL